MGSSVRRDFATERSQLALVTWDATRSTSRKMGVAASDYGDLGRRLREWKGLVDYLVLRPLPPPLSERSLIQVMEQSAKDIEMVRIDP